MQTTLNLFKSISDLEEKRKSVDEATTQSISAGTTVGDLSSSTLDNFSILMEKILEAWKFPDSERVHFDRESNDLIISGKPRGSRGKGMRAITTQLLLLAFCDILKKMSYPIQDLLFSILLCSHIESLRMIKMTFGKQMYKASSMSTYRIGLAVRLLF